MGGIRQLPWGASHLRSAYTWLFKKIKLEDLKKENEFIHSATDLATMYPMLEMAGKNKVKFIRDVLYLYRIHSSNNHPDTDKQTLNAQYIQNLPKYDLLN